MLTAGITRRCTRPPKRLAKWYDHPAAGELSRYVALTMYIFHYCCDRCGIEADAIQGRPGYYEFPDGDRIPVLTRTVWCRRCATLTAAEGLAPMDVLREELSRCRAGLLDDQHREYAEAINESLDSYIASRMKAIALVVERFQHRKSPNRCIECGSTDYDYIELEDDRMPDAITHPNCGGVLRLGDHCLASPVTFFLLDPEGNRIHMGNAT